jgi:YegS/Rv2252/BmrU family lipid kinase
MWAVIVNPISANGSTGKRWPRTSRILRDLLPPFQAKLTAGPGHARSLAFQAVEEGAEVILVHGGDGTLNEVVNGYLSHPKHERTALALLPHGTGSDFAKTLELPRDPERAATQLLSGHEKRLDVGLATFPGPPQGANQRYFVNIADIGFGGELVQYVNSRSKRLGGKLSFLRGLLVTLRHYRNKNLRISLEDGETMHVVASSVIVANGQYFGGGMWVAPRASLTDGYLDIVVVGDVTRREVIANLSRLYRGTLAEHPKVQTFPARQLDVASGETTHVEMDGELSGALPVSIRIQPEAIRFLC